MRVSSNSVAVLLLMQVLALNNACASETAAFTWDQWLVPQADVAGWQSQLTVRGQDPVMQPFVSPFEGDEEQFEPYSVASSDLQGPLSAESLERANQRLAERPTLETAASTEVVAESKVYAPTNVAGLLQESNTVQTVKSQRRSPISMDPYVWGYRHGQIYATADGAYWTPVRRDLDTMLSSIDPSLIEDVVVQPGPYGLRNGPGFAFINVVTVKTPRYQNGFESHYRTGLDVRTNGGGIYGRETVYGGGSDWGFIANWGIRTGSDYRPGNDAPFSKIPSGYRSQNLLAQFGMDLSPEWRFETRYQRIDATDLEFPVQFFDVNYQGSDAFSLSLINESPCTCSELRMDTWFNFTGMSGDTRSPGKRLPFPVIDRVEHALDDTNSQLSRGDTRLVGQTFGDVSSSGARLVKTYGEDDTTQLRFGADVRYVTQKLHESFVLTPARAYDENEFFTNLPRAELIDPGIFTELAVPWTPYWTTSVGARIDWAHTRADASELRENPSLIGAPENFHQNDNLYAFYVTSELEVSPVWTLTTGGGYAERPPTLVDRYADGVFLGIMQSGFNRIIGSPTLRKERAWQVDFGTVADYDWLSLRSDVFYSWIDDYNLYQGEVLSDPTGARLLRATNAELVTLFGFNVSGEMPLTQRLSTFAAISYLQGRDRNIQLANQSGSLDQSLYGIVPLEGRVGVTLTDARGGDDWGVELGTRIVDNQDQVAGLRQGSTQIVGFQQLELPTPGFTVSYVRGHYSAFQNVNFVAGIENLFDNSYYEHLDLRLPAQEDEDLEPNDPRTVYTRVFSPGFSPYVGVECTY